jgi:hypothetical protein
MIAAALVAAAPEAAGELAAAPADGELSLAPIPVDDLADAAEAALPPAPTTVVRQTRYYGTVTIDHRAHLARRASCKTCHGPGVVSKLVFTPKVAHGRCIGCHQEQAKGPTKCAGCHVRTPKPDTVVAAAGPGAAADPSKPKEPDPANVAAALAALEGPKSEVRGGLPRNEPFHRLLEVGLAAGSGPGPSVRLATHQDFMLVSQSFDRVRSGGTARTFALFGAGISRPFYPRVMYQAVALAGFDVVDSPLVALLPSIGLRAGLDWRPPRGLFLQHVTASLTCVVDLSRRASGRELGGTTLYGTLGTGFAVP